MLSKTIIHFLFITILLSLLQACGGGSGGGNGGGGNPASNSAPIARSVSIIDGNGGEPLIGNTLTGQYSYFDVDNDTKGTATFRWLRSNVAITNASSPIYILTAEDVGLPITFEVTPVALSGVSPGTPVTSAPITIPVGANNPPTASKVKITDVNGGALQIGDVVNGTYDYTDFENDLEGTSTFRWLRNGVAITNETSTSYILVAADSGQPITFEATPIAATGTLTGAVASSIAISFNEFTDNWAQISAGESHTLALKNDGSLWVWGSNLYAQLGDNTLISKKSPVRIGTDINWVHIAAGSEHSLAVKKDGSLWAWGTNIYGALGISTGTRKSIPFQIGTTSDWAKVFAGERYSLALKTDGTLWAWGRNNYGQLGINNTISQQGTPTQVGTDTHWVQISAGRSHTLGLKSDGSLWAWGRNNHGQLGNGLSSTSAIQLSPTQVGTATNWAQVASGYTIGYGHSLALKTDGTLWAWGSGGLHTLGNGALNDNLLIPTRIGIDSDWIAVSAGQYVSFAIKSGGTLWAWGWNIYHNTGIAGLGQSSFQKTPAQVGFATNWRYVSTTGSHTVGLKTSGTLSVWGNNYVGQLGIGVSGQEQNRSTPTLVTTLSNVAQMAGGDSHSAIIKTDGTLWTWGQGLFNELGNGSTTEKTSPIPVGSSTDWAQVVAGKYLNFAIKTDGTLWSWGFNGGGLGDGSTTSAPTPIQIGVDNKWIQIVVGYSHSLGLKSDGTLWAWGINGSGQLGVGSTTSSSTPIKIGTENTWMQVAAGSSHSLALKSDGTLWSWGRNSSGQRGDGTTIDSSSPMQVGTDTTWARVTAGENHSLALKKDGITRTLWAWGSNSHGQVGDGKSGTANNEANPIQIGTDSTWAQLSAGRNHSLALKTDGSLWAWGQNSSGQLGDGTTTSTSTPVRVGTNTNWAQVISGSSSSHSLGLKKDGSIALWGNNRDGQLGIGVSGNEQNRKTPALLLP